MQNPTILVRTTADPGSIAKAIRREMKSVLPHLPQPIIRSMDDLLAETVAQPRAQASLLTLFAAIALVLAAVGLYGVLAYNVNQRRRELGIRMALGAQRRNILGLVVKQGIALTLGGIAVGTVASLGLTRLLQSLLYQISPNEPVTFAAVGLVLVVTALIACWLPACRAAGTDPVETLRSE
jgi:ABC-type antimicrobial peptide transport system permease subunit